MKRLAGTAACAAALTLATGASALDGARLPTQHMHDAWTETEGLPQNSVKAIAEGPDGFLWIGTEEGLVRFDGASFRVFDRVTTTGRTTNAVYGVAIDARGDVVVLGGRDGVCTFREAAFACEPLPEGATGAAIVARGDAVWIGSDRGLFVRDAAGVHREDALGRAAVRAVAFAEGGDAYVVDDARGATKLANGRATPLDLGDLSPDDVLGVTRLRDGSVWFGTRKGPRVLAGGALATVAMFDGVPTGSTRFVGDDADGNVYLSIFDDGLYRTRGRAFIRVPLSSGQPAERLDAFFADDEGDVWIGSRLTGLHRLRDGPFVPWGAPEGIAHGFVHSVWARDDGDVLVATAGGGLYVVRNGAVFHAGPAEGLPAEGVDGFARGKDGTVLVATRSGLYRVARGTIRAELVPGTKGVAISSVLEEDDELWIGTPSGLVATRRGRTYGAAEGLPSTWIGPLYRAKDGALWIATVSGIVRMRGDAFEPVAAPLRTTPAEFVESGGTMLVATSDRGILASRGDEVRALGRDAGLFDDTVHVMLDGGDGRVWMSCNKGVFAAPRAEIEAFAEGRGARVTSRAWGRESGMRSRECNGGQPSASRDPSGRLWFATMQGVVSVDPRTIREPARPRPPVIDAVRVAGRTLVRPSRVTLPPDARALEAIFTSPRLAGGATTFEVRVAGAADAAWHATSGRSASFASLSPGSYVLEVRARDEGGTSDAARVPVEVPPRFVETTAFRVFAGAIAASLVLAFGLLRLRAVERARRTLARTVEERTRELASRNADLEARTRELDAALSDLKRAETDLVRAERMASVATLVRGIAHELNNPLGFVAGNVAPLRRYAEFLVRAVHDVAAGGARLEDVRLSPRKDLAFVERDLDKLLADMEEGARRAKLIVADLQSLTSPLGTAGRTIERVDVARVVAQSVRLLTPSKPEGVTITVDAPPCDPIRARAGEIEQAVVVLVDNALRAVGGAGTIAVRLSTAGDARVIEVEDDGPGMTEEVRARAVEPFFTTRAAGEGSGLGLAIAAGVAEHHRGSLAIDSAPGRGTRVRLTVRDAS